MAEVVGPGAQTIAADAFSRVTRLERLKGLAVMVGRALCDGLWRPADLASAGWARCWPRTCLWITCVELCREWVRTVGVLSWQPSGVWV